MISNRAHFAEVLLLKNIAAEKERHIQLLREENKRLLGRIDRLEMMLLPRPKPVPVDKKPAEPPAMAPGETGWQSFLNNHVLEIEEQERKAKERVDGISNEGRQAVVHQSGSGQAPRPNGGADAGKAASES